MKARNNHASAVTFSSALEMSGFSDAYLTPKKTHEVGHLLLVWTHNHPNGLFTLRALESPYETSGGNKPHGFATLRAFLLNQSFVFHLHSNSFKS
jgi:hypothetical protein